MTKAQGSLKKALIELLIKENLTQISVKKLCQQAQIGRSTFYTYYNNIDEVLEEIENNLVEQLSTKDKKITDSHRNKPADFAYFTDVVDFVSEHKNEILVLTKYNPNARFIEKWKNAIKDNLRRRGLPQKELIYEMVASEVIAAFDYYLLNSEQFSQQQIQEIVVKALKILEN
ncbi:hypothetical protein [Lactobacillus sp.]|uniref:TetR/AcrR family transcriptional regulator n=1 Tax=Lactobacillus sp. TaxID=1591 RepID=UPI0019B571AE|nr:hypothetical protein [Lactobacillus sp.]MBD5429060.1 TetR/AcrR family transcriptional regulator [Lactobacillus sp.]MBD5430238.1 TetR/AcrR family transcriptional regulator [Lactobacillus sp.]